MMAAWIKPESGGLFAFSRSLAWKTSSSFVASRTGYEKEERNPTN